MDIAITLRPLLHGAVVRGHGELELGVQDAPATVGSGVIGERNGTVAAGHGHGHGPLMGADRTCAVHSIHLMLLGGRQGGVITRNIDLISRIFGPELEGRTWDRILGQILTFFTNTSKQIAGLFFYCRVHKYPGDKCHPGYKMACSSKVMLD